MSAPAAPTTPRRNAAWWLHWLLVMLVVFDQVSAPLHRHHHDNGVDAAGMSLGRPHAEHIEALDRDDDNRAPEGHHAASAPRSETSASGQAADTGPDAAVAIGAWLAATWVASFAPVAHSVWPLSLALDRPPGPIPLSRPPDGRAPPQRA